MTIKKNKLESSNSLNGYHIPIHNASKKEAELVKRGYDICLSHQKLVRERDEENLKKEGLVKLEIPRYQAPFSAFGLGLILSCLITLAFPNVVTSLFCISLGILLLMLNEIATN